MLRERGIPMVYGVYEPGHLRHAMYYVNAGMSTPGSMWDFYLIGDYGLTAMEPIGTNGMKPSLESLYYYLWMIEEAKVQHPWYISIWGQGALDDTAILRRAIELGGHNKTGLELFYDPARNPTNLELLQQAQEIARDVGRPIATHDEARALYKLS
jgi:3-keto-5-aminohexanoate cleavage enzyme